MKVSGVPLQVVPSLVKCGVTVIVATTGVAVELVAVKADISPDPLAASPMLVVLFAQVYVVVPTVLPVVKCTSVVDAALQTT